MISDLEDYQQSLLSRNHPKKLGAVQAPRCKIESAWGDWLREPGTVASTKAGG